MVIGPCLRPQDQPEPTRPQPCYAKQLITAGLVCNSRLCYLNRCKRPSGSVGRNIGWSGCWQMSLNEIKWLRSTPATERPKRGQPGGARPVSHCARKRQGREPGRGGVRWALVAAILAFDLAMPLGVAVGLARARVQQGKLRFECIHGPGPRTAYGPEPQPWWGWEMTCC